MSLPRPILKGMTYLVTRRVTQRQFLLTPSVLVNQIILYCVALAAMETGVSLHAVVAMSNHLHIVATDRDGRLPEFAYIAFKYIAKCINAHRGREENLFAGGVHPSYVHLADGDAVLDKMAYVATNPVAAGLVRTPDKWPGVDLWRPGERTVKRPDVFFGDESSLPETVKLVLEPPPLGDDKTAREVSALVNQAVAERRAELHAQHKAAGRRYLGVRAILRQCPTDAPERREAKRDISPQVATKDRRLRERLLGELEAFREAYRQVMVRWKGGERRVVFPAGTYQMRVVHHVRCADS